MNGAAEPGVPLPLQGANGHPIVNTVVNPLPAGGRFTQGQKLTTFLQVFGDESKDPCKRNYERIMLQFELQPQHPWPTRSCSTKW